MPSFKLIKPFHQAGNGAAVHGLFGAGSAAVLFGLGFNGEKIKMDWCGAGEAKKWTGVARCRL
jgi:hypothetical protein